jgi:hypothetical protein
MEVRTRLPRQYARTAAQQHKVRRMSQMARHHKEVEAINDDEMTGTMKSARTDSIQILGRKASLAEKQRFVG